MERLGVAVVGCGIISRHHIDAFRNFPARARIVASCDTDIEKAREAAAKAGDSARAVTDYSAILADPEIGAVDLCLPHHLHAPLAIAAAKAGKHILCEKPLALTAEDCDRMAEAARDAGVVLMHGENMRMSAPAEEAAELVRSGKIGTIVGVQCTYAHWQWIELNRDWRTRPEESGGGHLIDGAIHFVDVMRHIAGDIVGVQAMTARFRPELGADSEDTAVLNFRFAAGHLGTMFASHAARGRGAAPMLTVFGTEGSLSLDAFGTTQAIALMLPGAPVEYLGQRSAWQDTFNRQAEHFLDVIQNGVTLRATPEDGRENLKVVLAAYESARTRREAAV